MRFEIPVVVPKDESTHWLAVEFENDETVIAFYLDHQLICRTDFSNLEELMSIIHLYLAESDD